MQNLLNCILISILSWALPSPIDKSPVYQPFFKNILHAYIWFNWSVVPVEKIAECIGAPKEDIIQIGKRMGLPHPTSSIPEQASKKLHCTIIRRNWHILPYEQIMKLLDWDANQLAYTLREDDFLFFKLGGFKPKCEPLIYTPPDEETIKYEEKIGEIVQSLFPDGLKCWDKLPLDFIEELSSPTSSTFLVAPNSQSVPKFCSSYFLQYGDPYLNLYESYPIEYVKKLRNIGVNGIWIQAVLYKLTPFPWDTSLSKGWETRLQNLKFFTEELQKIGISVYLYLNEPRAMPLSFFEQYPNLKGVTEGEFAALCTSTKEVQDYIKNSIKIICENVPSLGGFFTISASENLTNCWSHYHGENCLICATRHPADVIAELHTLIAEGIHLANSKCRIIAWDWGWKDEWIEEIIKRLPPEVALMSVSEWDIPIIRGGITSVIGEYSLNEPGPGPRARRTWELAKKYYHPIFAKLQLGTTWEIGSIPYLPVVENVARHALNLKKLNLDGYMLGWTLGGYPSPNLEVFNFIIDNNSSFVDDALMRIAKQKYGEKFAPIIVELWKNITRSFKEYPFHIQVVYQSPVQIGPANPLYPTKTNYSATMTGFPYDDVSHWCGVFPPEIFANQMEKVAKGFRDSINNALTKIEELKNSHSSSEEFEKYKEKIYSEISIIKTASIHFQSTANQTRFVILRDAISNPETSTENKRELIEKIKNIIQNEKKLSIELYNLQLHDTRLGFESSNHYFYVPLDLVHKALNCEKLSNEWLPNLLQN